MQENRAARPRPYDYLDFRKFLGDFYRHQRAETAFFSYRYFSRKAGFASHNVLKLVINGRRNIDPESIGKFSRALNLPAKEDEYFRLLVQFGQAKNDDERNELYSKLAKFRHRSKVHRLTGLQYRLYNEWYHCVVREYVACRGFAGDYAALARSLSPPIKPRQAKASIALLAEIGLIRPDVKGGWTVAEPTAKTEDEVLSLSVRQFNRQMIQFAVRALEEFAPERREISSMTFSVSKPAYERLKKMIQEFKMDLLAEIEEDKAPGDGVFQLNFQLFPLLRPETGR